jgi:hypothetical protein
MVYGHSRNQNFGIFPPSSGLKKHAVFWKLDLFLSSCGAGGSRLKRGYQGLRIAPCDGPTRLVSPHSGQT